MSTVPVTLIYILVIHSHQDNIIIDTSSTVLLVIIIIITIIDAGGQTQAQWKRDKHLAANKIIGTYKITAAIKR